MRARWLFLALLLVACAAVVGGCGSGAGTSTSGHVAAVRTSATTATARRRPRRPKPRTVAALPVPSASAPAKTIAVPVITYHRVHAPLRAGANAVETDLTLEPERFFDELGALERAGHHSVTVEQVYDALYRGGRLPAKPVLITVDDGYVDDVRTILPMLRHFGFTALFSVITSRFHEPGFMNRAQVRELDRAGMDIGSHTYSHMDLTAMSADQLVTELDGSKRTLERVLGHPVSVLTYPSGRFDDEVVAATRKAGYALAFTTQYGTTLSSTTPLTEPRLHIGRTATPATVLGLVGSH